MDGMILREARLGRKWTQQEAARTFGVTQAYWSMLEKGRRTVPKSLVRKVLKALKLPATALPLPSEAEPGFARAKRHDFSAELGALGYPGFAYMGKKSRVNPALLLFDALNQSDLDSRVREGLPWLALAYAGMDWDWLVRTSKLHDRQNRLGFAVSVAREVAERKHADSRAEELGQCLEPLERARLAREDTFCHDAMTQAERRWLREHRSLTAAHWNLLTDLSGERLAYE